MAFQFRFQLTHPELVQNEFLPVLREPISVELSALPRGEFLKRCLELIALIEEG
jgi:hypothetical protein